MVALVVLGACVLLAAWAGAGGGAARGDEPPTLFSGLSTRADPWDEPADDRIDDLEREVDDLWDEVDRLSTQVARLD